MRTGRPKPAPVLSAEEHAQLSSLAASRSLPHALVARAKVVPWSAQGETNSVIANVWTGVKSPRPGSVSAD